MNLKQIIQEVVVYLQGKKTYLLGLVLAGYSLLQVFNVITTTPEQNAAVFALLAALMGVSIKAGIDRDLGKLNGKE